MAFERTLSVAQFHPTRRKSICPTLSIQHNAFVNDSNQTTEYIEQKVIVPSCVEANGTITISTVI